MSDTDFRNDRSSAPGPDAIIGFFQPSEPYGCFSNWAYGEFTYAGIKYCCTEQYMMAQKVALGKRYDLYEQIMHTHDPARMKSLAGKAHFPEFLCYSQIRINT